MVISPLTEGKSPPFGATWSIPIWRIFHVAWWDVVMVSLCPRQYPVICPTVWIGRFSSVTISQFAYLYKSSFVFCPYAGGFEVFVDGLPVAGFSYEEVGSFGGGSWDYGGV